MMDSEQIVTDEQLVKWSKASGFYHCTGFLRLSLLELISKAAAGYRNSYTEENFMAGFCLLKADRTLNVRGRKFVCSMVYTYSHNRPECFDLMQKFRKSK
jgi:hypothetical protein